MVNLGFLGRQKYFKKLSILSFISPLHVKRLAIYFFSHFLSTSPIFIHSTTFHHLSSIQSPLLDKESMESGWRAGANQTVIIEAELYKSENQKWCPIGRRNGDQALLRKGSFFRELGLCSEIWSKLWILVKIEKSGQHFEIQSRFENLAKILEFCQTSSILARAFF